MNIVGAALPNVMFIVGILAMGLGLGIELKIVSLNKEIDKTGRIGAFVVGAILIGASVMIYLNPSIASQGAPADTSAAAQVVGAALQPATQAPAPTRAASPTESTPPTQAPAQAQAVAPAQPAAPGQPAARSVRVPNLHGLSDKDAQDHLRDAGLQPRRAEQCSGSDQADAKPKKGRIMCQNPPAGQEIASGAVVEYVLAGK
jgi:hypothetical protein